MADTPRKPLGRKAYGSIPHLPGSRIGPTDFHATEGQALILCQRTRDGRDRVSVTEKTDGSCVSVARVGDSVIPLIRAGWRAEDSRFRQHWDFARWVAARAARFLAALAAGERFAGEWLLQAHGTRYAIRSPEDLFVAFDVLSPSRGGSDRRLPQDSFAARCGEAGVASAFLLSDGPPVTPAVAVRKGRGSRVPRQIRAPGKGGRRAAAGDCGRRSGLELATRRHLRPSGVPAGT